MSGDHPHIIETGAETFERDAIERSREVPVVVDFWAAWCRPCQLLAPVLERLADEYAGRFVLVKADTERMPEIASALGVRGIPAVFGLRDGRVVDSFVGVQSEASIRSFLDALMPTPAERAMAEARALEATDLEAAEARYREALGSEPNDPRAKIGLARVLLARGRADEAGALIAELERRGYLEEEAERVKAELTLRAGAGTGGVESALAAREADPGNLGLQLRLAEALAAEGGYEEALGLCLDLVERDRRGVGEEARKAMLAIFQLLPDDSELVGDYRRRLSFVL